MEKPLPKLIIIKSNDPTDASWSTSALNVASSVVPVNHTPPRYRPFSCQLPIVGKCACKYGICVYAQYSAPV